MTTKMLIEEPNVLSVPKGPEKMDFFFINDIQAHA